MSNLETLHTLFNSNYQSMKGIHYNILMARQNEKQPIIYWGGLLSSYPELKEQHNTVIKNLKSIEEHCFENNCLSHLSKFKSFSQAYSFELENFLNEYDDSIEEDFIKGQLAIYKKPLNEYEYIADKLKYSYQRKIEFLDNRIIHLKTLREKKIVKSLSVLETVFLLNELDVIQFLLNKPLTQEKIGDIIAKILGTHPQDARGFVGRINAGPKSFGPSQQKKMEEIKSFLNSL